jgi:hypothetical protein
MDHLIGGKTARVETYGLDRWEKCILAVIRGTPGLTSIWR